MAYRWGRHERCHRVISGNALLASHSIHDQQGQHSGAQHCSSAEQVSQNYFQLTSNFISLFGILARLKDDKETMEDVVIACKALLDSLGLSERSRASIISTSSRSQRSDQESLRDRDRPESVKELGSTASLPPTPSVDKYRQQEQYPRWPEVPGTSSYGCWNRIKIHLVDL